MSNSQPSLIHYCANCGAAALEAASPKLLQCHACQAETTLPALNQTHEYCKACSKSFRYGAYFCPHCGVTHRAIPPSPAVPAPAQVDDRWKQRVSEAELAQVLNVLARPPNFRHHPRPDDLKGDYSAWFDGGAMREHTGTRSFHLADGTTAVVGSPLPWLALQIDFPDGRKVLIKQLKKS